MNRQPLISVTINCYNAEETIENTVYSILRQTYPHLEVIVVDDASTDRTRERLAAIEDERLQVIALAENGHISNANNQALARCRGELIAHCDADDIWLPEKLEKQLAFLQAHPEYGACFTVCDAVDERGRPLEDHRYRAENMDQAAMLRYLLTNGNFLCHSSMLARREVIDRVGKHDVSLLYLHDYDYWVRMVCVAPIYILDEPLVVYRIFSQSNSNRVMDHNRFGAHMIEHARLADRAIRTCPDALFLEAFRDRLRRPDLTHDATQTALEKAFVLMTMILNLPQNPVLGLTMLAELLADPATADVAKRDFHFTARDLYALQETVAYHNEPEHVHLMTQSDRLAELEERVAAFDAQLAAVRAEHERAAAMLHAISMSRSWKMTAPVRALGRWRQMRRSAKHPRLRDGRPAKSIVTVYGFYGHNLGDDLFLDRLFTRYPDTVFVVYDAQNYEDFFSRYQNVYSYRRDNPHAAKIDALGQKRGKDAAFERMLLKNSQAVVHIGGSIYQQVGDWETDMHLREKRYDRRRPFFSISSNFGPHHTDGFLQFWNTQFEKSRDICFRDRASAALFEGVKSVRCVPDLLFSQPLPAAVRDDERLFVSIIEPRFGLRSYTDDEKTAYLQNVSDTIVQWLAAGRTVTLAAFCPFEGDMSAVDTIVEGVPTSLRDKLTIAAYDGTIESANAILAALIGSGYVLATRFHAMLFGFVGGCRTLPVCYNVKSDRVLEDLGFAGDTLRFSDMTSLDADAIVSKLRAAEPFDVSEAIAASPAQFAALDEFIARRGGTIAP